MMLCEFPKMLMLSMIACTLAAAPPVTFAGGKITFQPPDGFAALTRDEIVRKFPGAHAPEQVFATERHGVSIAFDILPIRVPQDSLKEGMMQITQQIEKASPGVVWIRHEIVQMHGRSWIALEFVSQAVDTRIHNHIYLTSFDGGLLRFGYNSTLALYEKYRAALEKSRDTMRISQ